MRLPVLFVIALALGLLGCGVSPEDSKKLWKSVQGSLGHTGQALTATFTFDASCANGGNAAMAAKLDVNDDVVNATNAVFGYDITYERCQPDENTLDGTLHYAAAIETASSDTGAAVRMRYVYQGSVSSSGATNGTCDIDVVGNLSAAAGQQPGDEFSSTVHMDYSGTICGNDASSTLDEKADFTP